MGRPARILSGTAATAERRPVPPIRRVVVVGSTGAGKTTLAGQLAHWLGGPHVELDALYWGPDWTPVPTDLFRERVSSATAGPHWAVDGNYRVVRDIVWGRADTVIWLDYRLPIVLWQLLVRTGRRLWADEALWSGNRESLRIHLLTRDSLFLWAVTTYGPRRREYRALLQQAAYRHLHVVHLRSPRATKRWLVQITSGTITT